MYFKLFVLFQRENSKSVLECVGGREPMWLKKIVAPQLSVDLVGDDAGWPFSPDYGASF